MSTTRSSRRRKSANLTDDFILPDANISLGGVNTRRRHVRKQNENNDINSDTSTNKDFVTPNTKLTRKRQTRSVVKDLKQPKSESKAVLKERNKEFQNEPTVDNKMDIEVKDLLETKRSVRKTTRGVKQKISELSEESTSMVTKETSSAEKLKKKNRKKKTKKQSKENDSSSDENSKQFQSKRGKSSPVESLDHAAEHFPVNKLEMENSLSISSESFHSAAGGSLIDSGESPDSKSIYDGKGVSLSQSLHKFSMIQALTSIKTPVAENITNTTSEKSTEKQKETLNTQVKTNTSDILNATFDKSIEKCETMMKTPTSKIVFNSTFEKSTENDKTPLDNTRQSSLTLVSPHLLNTSPFLINDSLLQDDNKDFQEAAKTLTPESTSKKRYERKSSETTLFLPETPLKKEGTFIMDSTARSISSTTVTNKPNGEVLVGSEDHISDLDKTPENNIRTMSLPGSTPYHRDTRSIAKNSKSNKSLLFNITHSIEKDKSGGRRRSSSAQPKSSLKTRVAFCSPVPNPTKKGSQKINEKIIKSSLKGSNKSFVYKESDNEKRSSRKRLITGNDANDSQLTKRRCMTQSELNTSVNRLSRPRTPGSQGKRSSPLSHSKNTTPSKKAATPSKAIKTTAVSESKPKTASETKFKANSERKSKSASETKQLSRSKLPNFAALHKKQFDKMESLNECQERKAKRALHLLNSPKAPTLSKNLFGIIDEKKNRKLTRNAVRDNTYNRFGFKNLPTKVFDSITTNTSRPVINTRRNADANIFSIPVSEPVSNKNSKANIFTITTTASKPVTKPSTNKIFASRVDSGLSQKDKCRQVLTRERNTESVLAKNKKECRDFIRGVRTNRRFELQMKQRNLNG